jgi:hypothetical protein
VNDDVTEILSSITAHTVTVRGADGHPLIEAKALHVAAVGLAGILLAPRLAAAAAIGALLAGVTVSVNTDDDAPPAAPAV